MEWHIIHKSDSDLDALVSGVVLLHPQCGEKSVTGRLRRMFTEKGYDFQYAMWIRLVLRCEPSLFFIVAGIKCGISMDGTLLYMEEYMDSVG